MKDIKKININLDEVVSEYELAEILRDIAEKVEDCYTQGIVGWSAVSWNIECE